MTSAKNDLSIPSKYWYQMQAEAAEKAPEEACGLLAGGHGRVAAVFPVTNELHSPTRFRMEPKEQIRAFIRIDADKMDLLAIYHSHPAGVAYPSETDLKEFAYPGVAYVIWAPDTEGGTGRWVARGFIVDGGRVEEIRLIRLDEMEFCQ